MDFGFSGYGCIVTRPSIRVRALQIAKELGHADFKASNGWSTRFMNRHDLCIQQCTHIAKKLPKDVEDKMMNFYKFEIDFKKESAIPPESYRKHGRDADVL